MQRPRKPAEQVASPTAFFVLAGAFVSTGCRLGVALHSFAMGRDGLPPLRFIALASFLAYENYSLILREAATVEREAAIRALLAADPAVRNADPDVRDVWCRCTRCISDRRRSSLGPACGFARS